MSTIITKDGTQIYYKDWGIGQLNADLLVFLKAEAAKCSVSFT